MLLSKNHSLALGMMIVLCLPGCDSRGWFQTPEERVEQRAQERLDALMARDFEKAFSFLPPALRETTSWQRYGAKYAGVANWREASVKSVECEVDRCEVATSITYQMLRPKVENTRSREEVWIEVDGEWYFYPK